MSECLPILTCSAASADSPLLRNGQDSGRSGSAKSSPTRSACSAKGSMSLWPTPSATDYIERKKMRPSRAATGRTTGYLSEAVLPGYTGTSGKSADGGIAESISSQEDFLASLSAAPGSDAARQMTVISGRKCCALSTRRDPLGCLERTLLASSTWNSTLCFLTWKASATPAGRLLFQLAVSMPDTDETESGLWPTTHGFSQDGRSNGPSGNELGRAVNRSLWPTPNTRSGGPNTKSTATHTGGIDLEGAVKLMPTPTSNRRDGLQSHGVNVVSGSLNPTWVEWLMGYPLAWTDCADSATPSCRKSRSKSSKPSPKSKGAQP